MKIGNSAVATVACHYETPAWVVNALLERHVLRRQAVILEPCAGSGAIARQLLYRYPGEVEIHAVEIREEERARLLEVSHHVHIADFLTWQPDAQFDYIITNPPFPIAQEVVERALEIANGAEVIMLLRLGFFQAQERHEFWQKHPLSRLYVLSARPSFTGPGTGTDNSGYGWFCWNCGMGQEIHVIDSSTRPSKGR